MTIVSAFLMPGNPLPFLKQDNRPWKILADAARVAGEKLRASKPDVLLIYSTQWIAVLDELWQTRPHSTGRHVDENWYDYGDMEMNLRVDVELANACIKAANAAGIKSRAVDYEGFPIDSGTIAATGFLNPDGKIPAIVAANNVYHDFARTEAIGKIAAEQAALQNKRAIILCGPKMTLPIRLFLMFCERAAGRQFASICPIMPRL
jgi:2-aminophenol/2-amino-5-chlorophenol 1,6-dioxygenase alpha subunit